MPKVRVDDADLYYELLSFHQSATFRPPEDTTERGQHGVRGTSPMTKRRPGPDCGSMLRPKEVPGKGI